MALFSRIVISSASLSLERILKTAKEITTEVMPTPSVQPVRIPTYKFVRLRMPPRSAPVTAEQLEAESDKSPGVLMASGYIAGGAIAGIIIAFIAGVFDELDASIASWDAASNPLFDGPNADLLSMIPFVLMTGLLYWAARSKAATAS